MDKLISLLDRFSGSLVQNVKRRDYIHKTIQESAFSSSTSNNVVNNDKEQKTFENLSDQIISDINKFSDFFEKFLSGKYKSITDNHSSVKRSYEDFCKIHKSSSNSTKQDDINKVINKHADFKNEFSKSFGKFDFDGNFSEIDKRIKLLSKIKFIGIADGFSNKFSDEVASLQKSLDSFYKSSYREIKKIKEYDNRVDELFEAYQKQVLNDKATIKKAAKDGDESKTNEILKYYEDFYTRASNAAKKFDPKANLSAGGPSPELNKKFKELEKTLSSSKVVSKELKKNKNYDDGLLKKCIADLNSSIEDFSATKSKFKTLTVTMEAFKAFDEKVKPMKKSNDQVNQKSNMFFQPLNEFYEKNKKFVDIFHEKYDDAKKVLKDLDK